MGKKDGVRKMISLVLLPLSLIIRYSSRNVYLDGKEKSLIDQVRGQVWSHMRYFYIGFLRKSIV